MPFEDPWLPDYLPALLDAEFGSSRPSLRLIQVCRGDGYARDAALELLSAAQGTSGESWSERCLAVLLLENQLLRLAPTEFAEFDAILTALELKPQTGDDIPMHKFVLEEGYSTCDFRGFTFELTRKLSRLDRVHASIRRRDCD